MTKRLIIASSYLRVLTKLYQGEPGEAWEAAEVLAEHFNDLDALIREYRPTGASPKERGWIFWREAIIRALDDVISDLDVGSDEKAIANSIITYTDQWKPEDTEQLPERSAFEHPGTCPIYIDARKTLSGWLRANFNVVLSQAEETDLLIRFDRAIEDAVSRLWSKESVYFGQMLDQLSGPVADGMAQRRQWDAHNLWMRDRFWRKPLWGQEHTRITLSDLYIPLRGYAHTAKPTKEDQKFGDKKSYTARVFDMHSEVENWLKVSEPGSRDRMRVIGGSPGSGKSSFARKLGADVSRWENWRVIFVEVQGMSDTADLHSEIGKRLVRRGKDTGFEKNPLDMEEGRENMLLILDGLDELSKPGPEATAILTGFIRGVRELLDDKNSLRTIVLGRPESAAQALKESLQRENHLLNVLWMAKVDHERVKVEDTDFTDPDKLGETDQRDAYWGKWCAVTGNSPDRCLLKHEKFGELNVEPVLAYLVLKYLQKGGDPEQIRNRNDIYDRVIRDLKPRNWGSSAHPGSEDLSEDDFIFLLECLGLAAWANGGRVGEDAEFERIRNHCALDPDDYQGVEAATLQNIAMQFYTHIQGGYEFIHKSFGEYLTARGLISFVKRRLTEDREKLASWLKLTGAQEVDRQILVFLRDEAKLCEPSEALKSKKLLEKLFNLSQQGGFPAHKTEAAAWRTVEARQRNAEIAALACLNAFVRRVMETDLVAAKWSFHQPSMYTFMDVLGRIYRVQGRQTIVVECLDSINITGQDLRNAYFMNPSFQNANLEFVSLFRAEVIGGNFYGSVLTNANLIGIDMQHCIFENANLTYARLSHSMVCSVNFAGANLSNTVIVRAYFHDSNFDETDFTNSKVARSEFTEVTKLTQKQLESAHGSADTYLPKSLTHPAHWLVDEE